MSEMYFCCLVYVDDEMWPCYHWVRANRRLSLNELIYLHVAEDQEQDACYTVDEDGPRDLTEVAKQFKDDRTCDCFSEPISELTKPGAGYKLPEFPADLEARLGN